jgi:hypothetical protein
MKKLIINQQFDILQVDFLVNANAIRPMQQTVENVFLALIQESSGDDELKITEAGDDGQIHRIHLGEIDGISTYRYTIDLTNLGNGIGEKTIKTLAESVVDLMNELFLDN